MNILELTLVNALERMLAGEFGAVEYVRAMLERNKEVAQLNAVICLDEDRLLEAAVAVPQPLSARAYCLPGSAPTLRVT